MLITNKTMEKITIKAAKPYDILIEAGLLRRAGEILKDVLQPCKICVVTDSNVAELYASTLLISLTEGGYEPCVFRFEAGEEHKTTATVNDLVEYMARKGLTRSDAVVALGGGVTGDIAGFAASIYMRGIRYVQVPTSLLACLDSSVGGKTGANLAAGKNFVGSFWQPCMVICDYSLLETLPHEYYLDGIAEAVKCGAIMDAELFAYLGNVSPEARRIIKKCVEIKAGIVEKDEREEGIRAILNFGHTIGHAIEKCSEYTISHGHAVAIGMVVISRAAYNKGLCRENFSIPIGNLLTRYGLPVSSPFNAGDLAEAVLADKKRNGSYSKIIVLDRIGQARTEEISVTAMRDFIAAGL